MEDPFPTYRVFRFCVFFAGISAIIQSVVWFGLAITGLSVYYCTIDFSTHPFNHGTLLEMTLYLMYFRGNCRPPNIPDPNLLRVEAIDVMHLFQPVHLHIWIWIIMMFSAIWAISSLLMVIFVTKTRIKNANTFLSVWVTLTLIITFIDLTIFILFSVDFGNLIERSRQVPLTEPNITWLAAQNSAGIMMTIALRGYLLWAMNLAFALYFFASIFFVYNYNRKKKMETKNGFTNPAFIKGSRPDSEEIRRDPISAYEIHSTHPWYTGRPTELPRLTRHSRSASDEGLHEMFRRRQDMQYGFPVRREENFRRDQNQANINRELKNRNSYGNQPFPDYSPQMQKSFFSPNRSALKSSKF